MVNNSFGANTLDIKKLIAVVAGRMAQDEVTRESIVDAVMNMTATTKAVDIIKTLKTVEQSCYTKRNPICYNRARLVNFFAGSELMSDMPVVNREQPIAPVEAAPVAKTSEVKFSNTVIDATQDPSLAKFHPTRSYKHVLRRMNPAFPMNLYIFGDTGVGKSTSVLHIAKKQGRVAVRANLSKFADVDDLFGGMRIVDGTTFFDKGPALVAMEMGAILILDEVDSADQQLLTDLHPVLEGKGYLIKKLKQMVYPKEGFCVIATANTAGRGDLTGKFIGTGALNAAFLDRFATGIEYESPTQAEMKGIIKSSLPMAPINLIEGVCAWYDQINKSVAAGAVEERPSPRKVIDIIQLMMSDGITNVNEAGAKDCIIEATNLMDKHISQAFAELWDSMMMTVPAPTAAVETEEVSI